MLDEIKFGPDEWPTMNNGNGRAFAHRLLLAWRRKFAGGIIPMISAVKLGERMEWPQQQEPVHQLQNGKTAARRQRDATNLWRSPGASDHDD